MGAAISFSKSGFELCRTGDAKIRKNENVKNESVQLTIPVANTGKQDSAETVQVSVHKVGDTDGPIRTLRGVQWVSVDAGKTCQISIDLTHKAFEFFDSASDSMAVLFGEYEVLYGTSSDLKALTVVKITIQ